MKKLIFVAIIFLFSSKCFAFDFVTERQETTARQLCFLFTLLEDYRQTSNIKNQPIEYKIEKGRTIGIIHCEENKILGKFPSQARIDKYFLTCALGHTAITYILPDEYSKIWQCVWIGIQSKTLSNNYEKQHEKSRISYQIKFDFQF